MILLKCLTTSNVKMSILQNIAPFFKCFSSGWEEFPLPKSFFLKFWVKNMSERLTIKTAQEDAPGWIQTYGMSIKSLDVTCDVPPSPVMLTKDLTAPRQNSVLLTPSPKKRFFDLWFFNHDLKDSLYSMEGFLGSKIWLTVFN